MAFFIKQNDTSPSLAAYIQTASGEAVSLVGASVRLHIKETGGSTLLIKNMTITDATQGLVQYDWVDPDTAVAGTYNAEIQVTYSDGKIETYPNNGYFTITVTAELS
jgi:uncharacterized protein YfaS (alpha-2-macroglobulin family)